MNHVTTTSSPGHKRIVALLEAADEPLAPNEIAARCHISWHTFQNYRKALIAEGKMHITGYARNHHGPAVPLYAAGPPPAGAKTPARPKRRTSTDRKKDNGYYALQCANRRLRRPPDPALRALAGISAQ